MLELKVQDMLDGDQSDDPGSGYYSTRSCQIGGEIGSQPRELHFEDAPVFSPLRSLADYNDLGMDEQFELRLVVRSWHDKTWSFATLKWGHCYHRQKKTDGEGKSKWVEVKKQNEMSDWAYHPHGEKVEVLEGTALATQQRWKE
ncbi:hypothetical protein LQR31_02385 [Chromobacterium vaccinii]|uniref:hypothetical protein n=1 Tax=Chromobacterium vaccinii TaxID=1108595 RepID=UPI001E572AC2|nr:hypothetical protein [Chromobacterium vaccinii]MCD4483320.1 hypothetical protein [Chromobacterium vaccinii]